MAYTGDHVLVAWGGTMPGGEIWTNTLRMRDVNPIGFPDQVAVNGYLTGGFKDALTTYWNAVKALIGTGTKLEWMKANRVGTDGKYLDATTNVYTYAAPNAGTAVTNFPNQVSAVVSTTTGLARGRAHIGRWFLPGIACAVDAATGLLTVAQVTTFANASAAFIGALNDTAVVLGVDQLRAAVMSNLGAGVDHDITGVRVGRVPDTQRRRRNKIVEAPVAAAVP